MCCMRLLVESPNVSLSAHDRHWLVASSQELLGSYTCDKELFCRRLVTGDKTWIYHWAPISKSEFMQWKDVDRPHLHESVNQPLTGYMATVFLGYRRTAYDKLSASWKDN